MIGLAGLKEELPARTDRGWSGRRSRHFSVSSGILERIWDRKGAETEKLMKSGRGLHFSQQRGDDFHSLVLMFVVC